MLLNKVFFIAISEQFQAYNSCEKMMMINGGL
jgi:hypothetical protein